MRKCPKCSKEYGDDSAICRTCGAILEATELPAPAETSDTPDNRTELLSVSSQPKQPTKARRPPWSCPHCGETVPRTFEVCWNCGTSREGVDDPDFRKETPEDGMATGDNLPDAPQESQPPREAEPEEDLAAGDNLPEGTSSARLPSYQCPKCGSSKGIPNVRVVDQGESSNGDLRVLVCGAPEALIFKDRLYGKLTANICGDCGHVDLQVENPGELYKKYQQSRG